MRIVTGIYKGRKLKSPKNSDVRPTSDKVKEAMFDMLFPYMGEGFIAADVFSGSGNLGLEAVSRGAATVYFSDDSRESLALIKENIRICGAEDHAVILAGDFRQNIKRIRQKLDIVFLDPPYAAGFILPALDVLDEQGSLEQGGVVVCEHAFKDTLPEEYRGFKLLRCRKYGAVGVSIYERC